MRTIYPSTATTIAKAASLLRHGTLVAFPTETVYGLGADAGNAAAVAQIFALKGRPSTNPLIVHGASVAALLAAVQPTESQLALLYKLAPLWPGPLSVVLPRNPATIPDIVTAGNSSVAIRIPDHPVALALLEEAECLVAAPSANRSNYVSPTTAHHVAEEFGDSAPFILDGGECSVGVESTVLSLLHPIPTVLRPGAITTEQLGKILGTAVTLQSQVAESAALSPGLQQIHYAPHTRLRFLDEVTSSDLIEKRFGAITVTTPPPAGAVVGITLAPDGELEAVARGLYAALRELDKQQLDLILIERCPATGIGVAILNRLERARARG